MCKHTVNCWLLPSTTRASFTPARDPTREWSSAATRCTSTSGRTSTDDTMLDVALARNGASVTVTVMERFSSGDRRY
jgi:hypothetical protein